MKLISWNVNGIRACVQKGFLDFFKEADADIFCIQETKMQEGQLTLDLDGYYQYWNYAVRKGYSGTAVFTKKEPLSVSYGIGIEEHDQEGRALPMGGRTVHLTTPYSLEMRGDSAISYLPYFGRAYSLPYGGGDGMRFEESITDYQSTFDKKGTARIKFVARTKEDTFRFDVQVFSNGSAIISVTPTNRQNITYQGELAPKKED